VQLWPLGRGSAEGRRGYFCVMKCVRSCTRAHAVGCS
jgi:hypothetical protein